MGPNTNVETPEQEEAEFAYLATIDRSVQGDASIGLRGYPFSVRAFRDSVAAATRFPVLKEPVAETDPIGIRRALSARRQLSGVLESLSLRVVDTTVSRPLRLALYFYHNSTQSLERVETLLYQGVEESSLIDRVRGNWQDGMLRPQAANALNDALEWERQAAEQIALALASHNPRKR
jgi:hypothetical protein